jgi:hypothetical protein
MTAQNRLITLDKSLRRLGLDYLDLYLIQPRRVRLELTEGEMTHIAALDSGISAFFDHRDPAWSPGSAAAASTDPTTG